MNTLPNQHEQAHNSMNLALGKPTQSFGQKSGPFAMSKKKLNTQWKDKAKWGCGNIPNVHPIDGKT